MSTISADISLVLSILNIATSDLETPQSKLAQTLRNAFTNGSGAGQVNQMFSDTRTLATATAESLDLNAGGLLDVFGNALTLTKLKVLAMSADPNNTTSLIVGNVANGIVGFFGASTHSLQLNPGSLLLITSPDAGGYTITAATGDLLKVSNGSGASANYNIAVLGA